MIALKTGLNLPVGIPGAVAGRAAVSRRRAPRPWRPARALPLLFHGRLKAFNVHGQIAFLQDLLGQLQRETKGIIKLEGNLSGQFQCPGLRCPVQVLMQDLQALLQSFPKPLLFDGHDPPDEILTLL